MLHSNLQVEFNHSLQLTLTALGHCVEEVMLDIEFQESAMSAMSKNKLQRVCVMALNHSGAFVRCALWSLLDANLEARTGRSKISSLVSISVMLGRASR
jgi:hypothetical protein